MKIKAIERWNGLSSVSGSVPAIAVQLAGMLEKENDGTLFLYFYLCDSKRTYLNIGGTLSIS